MTLESTCRAVVMAIVTLVIVFVPGCASREIPDRDALFLSQAGQTKYEEARRGWFELHSAPLSQDELESGRRRLVLRPLDDAIQHDPQCFLFHSKLGEMRLDAVALRHPRGAAAESAHALAFNHFGDALRICPDWPPAWIGLALIARLEGKYAEARRYLESAEVATSSLEAWDQPPGEAFLSFLGTIIGKNFAANIGAVFNSSRLRDDPTITPTAAKRIVATWLKESWSWNVAARGPGNGVPGATWRSDVFEASRALIQAERAATDLDESVDAMGPAVKAHDPAYVARMRAYAERLREVLTIDKNLFVVKFRLGATYMEIGEFDKARVQFEAFLDFRARPTALAANYDPLVAGLLVVYTQRFLQEGTKDTLDDLAGFSQFVATTAGTVDMGFSPFWNATQRFFAAFAAHDSDGMRAALDAAEHRGGDDAADPFGSTQKTADRVVAEMRRLIHEATNG